ncbi:MAG: phosphotransacetylase family protein [Deltaproteobacteria bacterium]|nr:phosphotransacetylase family protein [Deltaproteobacteria bacterium]MBW2118372.1 phosphotransacetylase family protein [Deltaproteobacteria bacterium]MBW2345695.1 phosphotransacetylase family protein [Deltaproteobacteria bacterium]
MSFLFTGTTGDHAGHSLITWAIVRRLVGKGLNVGFMKPFGTHPVNMEGIWTDRDAFLFKEVLNLQEPLNRICPYLLSEETWGPRETDEILDEIRSLAQELGKGKDVLIIMGSDHIFFDDVSRPVPEISLITRLESDFILVNRYHDISRSIYSILSVSSLLKDRLRGIMLNRVPTEKIKEIRSKMIPSLVREGVPPVIALPEDPVLSFRSLGEIRESLDGEFLFGEANIDRPVGGMTVGSADLEGELRLFKRAYNKIILLGSSPETETEGPQAPRSVAGIILTGGRNPAPRLLQIAEKAKVPLILVHADTFAVLKRLEQNPSTISPKDEDKVRHMTELMDTDGGLDRLLQSLELIQ